jgi:D-ribose pyranase
MPVLRTVLGELVVERATLAEELADEKLVADLTDALGPVPCERVTHEELKVRTARARVVVRTGEDTPYANIVLRAGVAF